MIGYVQFAIPITVTKSYYRRSVNECTSHYNMNGDPDRNLKFKSNTGGAGNALQRDGIEVVNLSRHDHPYYNIDSTKVWKNMRSIFSIPIHDNELNIIGILNIDTDKSKFHPIGILQIGFQVKHLLSVLISNRLIAFYQYAL
jgi:hypothetical protein